jgi:hypothetical protein
MLGEPAPLPVPLSAGPELRLWGCAADGGELPMLTQSGPLTDASLVYLETGTEAELCSLHALWNLARQRHDEALTARAIDAADWLIENIQPDNGTNHPWGLHVFAWLAVTRGSAESRMYAESLLHNALVAGGGRPDRFSACVLWDGANRLAELA